MKYVVDFGPDWPSAEIEADRFDIEGGVLVFYRSANSAVVAMERAVASYRTWGSVREHGSS